MGNKNTANGIGEVFALVAHGLSAAEVAFLMIGGHAVNHYGYARTTLDLDFMIATEDVSAVRDAMRSSGFTNISEGSNVIFFHRPDSKVRVDFLPVGTSTMRRLMERAVAVEYGGVRLHVPCLEDLLAMKLFALKNGSPLRQDRDFSDVVHLALANGLTAKADLQPLCTRYANASIYAALMKRMEGIPDA